ncbi:MAG: GTP cyclohydrolase II [Paracoccaceae bacterium]
MLTFPRKSVRPPELEDVEICASVDIALSRKFSGKFIGFTGLADDKEHVAIKLGPDKTDGPPLVRLHSECLTGDVFGSMRCDCGEQLNEALNLISETGGYVLYLRQEGRGIGLIEKLRSYVLQSSGYDTYEANEMLNHGHDLRDYGIASQMLTALGVEKVRLLTNNLSKVRGLQESGIEVCERVSTSTFVNPHNERYLNAKRQKGHHQIKLKL